jgi:hypothetical protein
MAEPESAVLPITPYPIGCLKLLVVAFPRRSYEHRCGHCCQPSWADVQTTKQSDLISRAPNLAPGVVQPLQTTVTSEQLQ